MIKKNNNNSQGQLDVLVGDLNINMLSLQCIYENLHSNIGVYIYIYIYFEISKLTQYVTKVTTFVQINFISKYNKIMCL